MVRSFSFFSLLALNFDNPNEEKCNDSFEYEDYVTEVENNQKLDRKRELQLEHGPKQELNALDLAMRQGNFTTETERNYPLYRIVKLLILVGSNTVVRKEVFGNIRTAYEIFADYLKMADNLNFTAQDEYKNNIFHLLAQDGDRSVDLMRLLLDKYFKANNKNELSSNLCDFVNQAEKAPLQLAVESCAIETIKLLAEKTTKLEIWRKFLKESKATRVNDIHAIKSSIKEKPNPALLRKEFWGILLLNEAWQNSYRNFIDILDNQVLDDNAKAKAIIREYCAAAILFDLASNKHLKDKLFALDCKSLIEIARKWSYNSEHSKATSFFNQNMTLFFLQDSFFVEKLSTYNKKEKFYYIETLLEAYATDQSQLLQLKANRASRANRAPNRNKDIPEKMDQYFENAINAIILSIKEKQQPKQNFRFSINLPKSF